MKIKLLFSSLLLTLSVSLLAGFNYPEGMENELKVCGWQQQEGPGGNFFWVPNEEARPIASLRIIEYMTYQGGQRYISFQLKKDALSASQKEVFDREISPYEERYTSQNPDAAWRYASLNALHNPQGVSDFLAVLLRHKLIDEALVQVLSVYLELPR